MASYHLANQISELPLLIRPRSAFRPAKLTFLVHGKPRRLDAPPVSPAPQPTVAGSTDDGQPRSDTQPPRAGVEEGLVVTERQPEAEPVAPTPGSPDRDAHTLVEGYTPGTLLAGKTPAPLPAEAPRGTTAPQAGPPAEPDPWDGFDEALAEMRRQEQEAEKIKLRAAMRPSVVRTDDAPLPGGARSSKAAINPSHSTPPSTTAVESKPPIAPSPEPAHADNQPVGPTRVFTKLLETLDSWRTSATSELLAVGGTVSWEQRLAKFGQTRAVAPPARGTGTEGADEAGEDPRLPAIDSRNQQRLRVAMVTEQLLAALPTVLEYLELPQHAVQTELTVVVGTLALHRDTVHFTPAEWRVLATTILVALASHVDPVHRAWAAAAPPKPRGQGPRGVTRLEHWLQQLGLDAPSFSRLVCALRDPAGDPVPPADPPQ